MKSPALTKEQARRIREGVELFNRGEYFDCHELLEAIWLETTGETKLFLQGLIQLAVSYHHLRRKNFIGSGRLMRSSIQKLSRPTESTRWIDSEDLVRTLAAQLEEIESRRARPDLPAPKLQFLGEL